MMLFHGHGLALSLAFASVVPHGRRWSVLAVSLFLLLILTLAPLALSKGLDFVPMDEHWSSPANLYMGFVFFLLLPFTTPILHHFLLGAF